MDNPPLPSPRGSLGRFPFIIIVLISSFVSGAVLEGKSAYAVFALFGFMILMVILAAFRLKNIGWSAAFCLLGIVPVVNIIMAVALAILPPNYAKIRKLDAPAWIYAATLIGGWVVIWSAKSYFAP